MSLKANICQVCGGNLKDHGTYYKCESCDTIYRADAGQQEQEIQNDFWDAERNLSVSPPRFDEAESDFTLLTQKYPDWSAGYWGLVRAKFGIKFERDSSGDAVPSCYKSVYEDFRDTEEYKKAKALAETPELRQSYEKMAEYIARVAADWRNEAQKYDYDVFISFKASDDADGSETNDTREMQNLYTYLTEQGYRVFFSPVSLKKSGISGRQSEPYIFNALDKAKALIVYGSKKEYFTSTWVQNEWQRYLRAMEKYRKPKNSLIVLYEKFNPKTLPQGLRNIQGIDYGSKTAYPEILGVLEGVFSQLRENEVAPTIDRIDIEAGKVGKRVASVGERIGTVELGATVAPKKGKKANLSVQMRELGVSAQAVEKEEKKFSSALICLKKGYFAEAGRLFDACLKENDKNGDIWLGKLCVEMEDSALYEEVKGNKAVSAHSAEIVNDYVVLQNAIDYAADKPTAERLLSFVYQQIAQRIGSSRLTSGDTETVSKLFRLCGDYNSENAKKMRRLLAQNTDKLARMKEEDLLDYLFDRISNVGELIAALEKTMPVYLGRGEFDSARKRNDRLLELDETNGKALMNAFYIDNEISGEEDLMRRAALGSAGNFDVLEKGLPKISKADAENILSVLCATEETLFQEERFGAAERYFVFIVKYDFAGRDVFLDKHLGSIKILAQNRLIAFYEKLLSVYPNRNAEFHIENRLSFANALLEIGDFAEAETMYRSVLTLESENAKALQGIFACDLRLGGEKPNVRWENWDMQLFERILAACPTKETQTAFINRMCRVCIDSMKRRS